MVEKGKLIAIGVNTKEELSKKKIELLKSVQVIFAHARKDEENKALIEVTPILEERKDYKKLMLVKPVFPKNPSEQSLNNAWDMAAAILDNYLNSGRDVGFLTSGDPLKTDFKFAYERLKDTFDIEIYE